MLGAYLLVAFTLTGFLLVALLLGGLLLSAVVHVQPRFLLGQSIGRLSLLRHRSSVAEYRLTYPDRLAPAYTRHHTSPLIATPEQSI